MGTETHNRRYIVSKKKVEPLILEESNLFASMKSMKEVLSFMESYAGKENAHIVHLTNALTLNCLARLMAEHGDGKAEVKLAKPLFKKEVK